MSTLLATICGADTWDEIEDWGNTNLEWLKSFLVLDNGIPSHDTFNRVFQMIDPKAIPELLKTLSIKGCIVTIDAMGTQKAIASQIVESGAEYILSLKANPGTLYQEVSE